MNNSLPLRAYVVSLVWGSGMMSIIPVVAPTDGHAGAIAATVALRAEPVPEGELTGVFVREVSVEWLRFAIRTIEEGKPSATPIVRLVQPEQNSFGDSPVAAPLPDGAA